MFRTLLGLLFAITLLAGAVLAQPVAGSVYVAVYIVVVFGFTVGGLATAELKPTGLELHEITGADAGDVPETETLSMAQYLALASL